MGTLFNPPRPKAPMAPPPAAHPAVLGSSQAQLSGETAKAAGKSAQGLGSNDTIKTSAQGLKAPDTTKNTLLG
jgi:hypothetical protein